VRTKGRITSWNDEKAYGFISPLTGGGRIFVHIKAFSNRARRPAVGDIVTYSISTDSRGRPCAEAANIAGVPQQARPKPSSGVLPQSIAAAFLTAVGVATLLSAIPMPVLVVYLVVSAGTFAAYMLDKAQAEKGAWRISENKLHVLALVGGWPGALVAQTRLRHKTRKQPFRAVFWVTVVVNCAAFVWLTTPEGANAWRSIVSALA
jgi:uncharacterized membrane protein YsdA (DUF1294 family)/cold shock CspA family protein